MGKQKSDIVSHMMRGVQIVKAISDALRDRGGDDTFLVKILGENSVFPGKIADILMGRDTNAFPSLLFASSLIPEYTDAEGNTKKWEVLEDVQPSNFKISDLEMVTFLQGEETSIRGKVMRERAVSLKANLGLVDAKRLLDNQSEIPVEFRGKILVFTGTLLRDPDGSLFVACLSFDGGRWCLGFGWVGNVWDGCGRLLRCK